MNFTGASLRYLILVDQRLKRSVRTALEVSYCKKTGEMFMYPIGEVTFQVLLVVCFFAHSRVYCCKIKVCLLE